MSRVSSSGQIEQALVETIGPVLLFTEVATDDEVDLDTAVRLQEAVAWSLRRLTPEQRERVSRAFSELADTRDWDAYAGSTTRAETLRQMPETLGLVARSDGGRIAERERDGPAAVSRKLAVVTGGKAREQARRQAEALRHNGIAGRWEVPSEADAVRAAWLLEAVEAREIGVRIVRFTRRPVVNQAEPLVDALVDCWCFTELTSDELLDPDWAVSLEEDMASVLTSMPRELRLELASVIDLVVARAVSADADTDSERTGLLRQLPDLIGLLDDD